MPVTNPNSLVSSFLNFASDIKLAHSVFALPFAASAVIIGRIPIPSAATIGLLVGCMITARTFAMGMNRWLDRNIDQSNPRTANRAIPSGRLSSDLGIGFSLAAAFLFVTMTGFLNPLALYCALPMLMILAGYSLMKRVTWLTHFYLGACLGLAPIAVSIGISGTVAPAVTLLGVAITLWTAGFDCLYSLQDMDFDRGQGLHSIPKQFGPLTTYFIAAFCFFFMLILLVIVGEMSESGRVYRVGLGVIAAILAYELWIVRDIRFKGQSANLNAAFFTSNAIVSVVFFAFCTMDLLL